MVLTRRRGFQVFGRQRNTHYSSLLDDLDSTASSDDSPRSDSDEDPDSQEPFSTSKRLPKRRRCCGTVVYTPNTSRFSEHLHSRIFQKFPFLIEMFYWIITYLFYRMTKVLSQKIFYESVWDVAQENGLAVLEFEQYSWLRFLFPYTEHSVQQWFMNGHQNALTVLNRAYALIHIPGTVGYVLQEATSKPKSSMELTRFHQLHRMVLLHCTIAQHFRHYPSHLDPDQPICLFYLHTLSVHATTATSERIRLFRLGAT